MVSIPFVDAPEAPPAVRRPDFALVFGGGDAALWHDALTSLTLDLAMAPAVNALEMVLAVPAMAAAGGALEQAAGAAAGAVAGALGGGDSGGGPETAAVGDSGTLGLGYADSGLSDVFSGTLESVRRGLDGSLRMTATDGSASLARLRASQSYEEQSAGDVVGDLAGQAGVATGAVESGVDLAFYAVDDRRSAWDRIAELARRSDYTATISAAGELAFAPLAEGSPLRTFTYGDDLIELAVTRDAASAGGVRAVGDGAAGSEGADAWAWLVKDPQGVSAEAGEEPRRRLADGALRSSEAASSAAAAAHRRDTSQTTRCRALVPGAPEVVPTATVEIAGTPDSDANGLYFVARVRHTLDKRAGFMTRLDLVRLAPSGGGLLDALAGALP